jgi:uncharacterized protein (TIGR02246 family)
MFTTMTLSRRDAVSLYTRLLDAWNARDAHAFAEQFTENGTTIGFDGSRLDGRAAIASSLDQIFRDHQTAAYVAKVRDVRELGAGVVLLRSTAGMIPPGASELKPERNAEQSLVAVLDGGEPKIALFQNTPARLDGRPELVKAMTVELTEVYKAKRVVDAT